MSDTPTHNSNKPFTQLIQKISSYTISAEKARLAQQNIYKKLQKINQEIDSISK